MRGSFKIISNELDTYVFCITQSTFGHYTLSNNLTDIIVEKKKTTTKSVNTEKKGKKKKRRNIQ